MGQRWLVRVKSPIMRGMIDYVYVTNTYNDETPKASRKVVDAILESDMVIFRTRFSLYIDPSQSSD